MSEWENLEQVACSGAHLLTEAIRELLMPQHLDQQARKLHDGGKISETYAHALTHTAIMSVIIGVCRVKETRDNFLVWLFSDAEMRKLGLPPIEEFVGNWGHFLVVRDNFVVHTTRKKSKKKKKIPGQILSPTRLAEALSKTGLNEPEVFLRRVREALVLGVENVRDEILKKYPVALEYIEVKYPMELEAELKRRESHPS